ncbi:MlaD family protein [Conexibacter sp. DBS9H8]|uniref:MlaD family protein n=1 Tax=Conexibacter sp. DBS9H8 TaxID=2937801 RepID=UPI00200E04C7|nr:MlaD family protein [Conexibacter sp. DBS9H8]
MVTRAPSLKAISISIGFALSCVGLIIFVWVAFGGSVPLAPQGYRVSAVFNETGLLVPNADVRLAGVNVGKVVSVRPEGTKSLVLMDLEQRFVPIPADTRAILREKTLLGEAYVELSSGNRSGPKLADGGTIPNAQVGSTQQLDQVLNAFTPRVQREFQAFLGGTGAALAGRGQDLNDAFGNLGPAASELDALAGVLNGQGPALSAMVRDSGTVLSVLGQRGSQLGSLVSSGDAVVSATSAEGRSLTAAVRAFPAFLVRVRSGLVAVNRTLGVLRPSLDALSPVVGLVRPALVDLTGLSGSLVSLLARTPAVFGEAERVLPDVTRFLSGLKPAVDTVLPFAEQVVPVINVVSDYRSQLVLGMADLAAILQARSAANTTSDALGEPVGVANYVRQVLTFGPDSAFGQSTRNPAVRSNTYFAPGALAAIGNGGEASASCAGTGTGNVPCRLQPGFAWGHGIPTGYYPHVKAVKP